MENEMEKTDTEEEESSIIEDQYCNKEINKCCRNYIFAALLF